MTELSGLKVSLTGFTDAAMAKGGYEIIPVLWCAAEPSSYVTNETFERIADQLVAGIRDAGALDGIYLELHGAMVTETFEDGEGELLRRIRDVTGPDLPIADKVLVVEAPGAYPCRLDKINYRNLRPGVRLGPGGPRYEK